jgi:hypothetical protein
MKTLKVLELEYGTGSFSKEASKRGHETFSIDIDPKTKPDLCIDILNFKKEMLPKEFRKPDIIWASTPCTTFSVMVIKKYWINQKPKTSKTYMGLAIAMKNIEIIEELKPKYFFIENPRGMLRQQHFMKYLKRDTVTYCKYGFEYMKPTDIWHNTKWIPRPICQANDLCHVRAPRGSRTGLRDSKNLNKHIDWDYGVNRDALERGRIPPELCNEILDYCEGKKQLIQEVILC